MGTFTMKHDYIDDDDITDASNADPNEGKRFSRRRAKQEHRYERRIAKTKLRNILKQTEEDFVHDNNQQEDYVNADV